MDPRIARFLLHTNRSVKLSGMPVRVSNRAIQSLQLEAKKPTQDPEIPRNGAFTRTF